MAEESQHIYSQAKADDQSFRFVCESIQSKHGELLDSMPDGVIITAAYHLWAMQRIMLGPYNNKWDEALSKDMDTRELIMLIPLGIVVLVLGFYPMPALELMATGMDDLRNIVLSAAGG